MIVVLFIARLAFLAVNFESFAVATGQEIFLAFIKGFRFDVATAMLSVTAPLLLLWIPASSKIRHRLSIASCWLSVAIIASASIVLIGDIFFFVENSHHVTMELVDMFSDAGSMAMMLIDGYLLSTLVAVGLLIGVIWFIFKTFQRSMSANEMQAGSDWRRIYYLIPILVITVIGARGGLQKEPLKSADAITGRSSILGNIVLNGWYTFLTEAVKSKRPDQFMDESIATAEVRRLVDPDGDYQDPKFPLLRRVTPKAPVVESSERLNVVLIIVESLNAGYLQTFGGKQEVMPFLDSLSRQSLAFTNFNSIGTRSFRGVTAILASYPNLSVDSYRLTSLLPKLRGLGEIFQENGYAVRFMHGAPENSMGIEAICSMSGYELFVSEEDFPVGQSNGSWGIWDHIALERMSKEMDSMPEPFHYGIFTLCTHAPWTLPDGFVPRFDKETENGEILNTFVYLDGALRDFFDRESKCKRFARTVYVIVGDHTTHSDEIERFHVGSIFYAPSRIQPRVDTRLGDQLDLMPTILDAAGIETICSAFGTSLLAPFDSLEWGIHYQSGHLNFRFGNKMLVSSIIHNVGLYQIGNPDFSGGGLLKKEPETTKKMTFQLKALYQTTEMMMKFNRITPPNGIIEPDQISHDKNNHGVTIDSITTY